MIIIIITIINYYYYYFVYYIHNIVTTIQALRLVDDMWRLGHPPDTATCNAALSACERASRWEPALRLLGRMLTQVRLLHE